MADGESISVWFGPDELDLLTDLDEFEGSRSEHVKEAIGLYLGVHDVLDEFAIDEPAIPTRLWVRSVLRDYETGQVAENSTRSSGDT